MTGSNPTGAAGRRVAIWLLAIGAWMLVAPAAPEAYVGPGAGLTAIGTVIAFVGAILLAIVGFVWYPVKRLWLAMRSNGHTSRP